MATGCSHLSSIVEAPPDSEGCSDCLKLGSRWVHLRRCTQCGHVGCCDNSPNRHATAHFRDTQHPIIQSYEPREEWYWCYADELFLEREGEPPSPSHP